MPTKKMNHHRSDTEIEYVISGRQSPFDEQGENNDLERIRNNGQHHGGPKAQARRDCDGVVSQGAATALSILTDAPPTSRSPGERFLHGVWHSFKIRCCGTLVSTLRSTAFLLEKRHP